MNQEIVNELDRLREQYDEYGDDNREKAYRRAVEIITKHPRKIMSGRDAMKLKWIGKGIGWRIDQILGTNTVDDEDDNDAAATPKPKKRKPRVASSPPQQQLPVVPKMRAKFVEAPPTQKRGTPPGHPSPKGGVRAQFVDRQAREEHRSRGSGGANGGESVTKMLSRDIATRFINDIRQLIAPSYSHATLADCYRRGHRMIPRLVMLVTNEHGTNQANLAATTIIHHLSRNGTLLRSGFRRSRDGSTAQGDVRFRMTSSNDYVTIPIFIICVAHNSWPCALARYTGPTDVWQQMKDAAASTGILQLSEQGLFQLHRGAQTQLFVQDERHLFQLINVEYTPPEQRG